MSVVLLFNLEGAKSAKIKNLCRQLFIETREVEKEDFGKPISDILGVTSTGEVKENSAFEQEMLYLSGLGGMLGIFLEQLKRKKLTVDLKAVKTEANISFTPAELCRELDEERRSLERNK